MYINNKTETDADTDTGIITDYVLRISIPPIRKNLCYFLNPCENNDNNNNNNNNNGDDKKDFDVSTTFQDSNFGHPRSIDTIM